MPESNLLAHVDTHKIGFDELKLLPAPDSTDTHKVIPHHEVVGQLVETLSYRHISVHKMEYAVSKDANKCFGLIELTEGFNGARFALGLRNSHDKTMRLALTVGYRVFVCDNMAFNGDFTPVLAKHSKHFNLTNALEMGVGMMQRNFKPMVESVEKWQGDQITDAVAKLIIYRAFTEGELEAPRHLDRVVHQHYFEPEHEDFRPRTMWSISNAFTSAFKELEAIPQYKATAKLGGFLASIK